MELSTEFFVNPRSKWSIVFPEKEVNLPDVLDDGTTPRIGCGTVRIYLLFKERDLEVEKNIKRAVAEKRFLHRVFDSAL